MSAVSDPAAKLSPCDALSLSGQSYLFKLLAVFRSRSFLIEGRRLLRWGGKLSGWSVLLPKLGVLVLELFDTLLVGSRLLCELRVSISFGLQRDLKFIHLGLLKLGIVGQVLQLFLQ